MDYLTMRDEALVERLRDCQVCSLQQNSCRNSFLLEEAAAHIEKLEDALRKVGVICHQHNDP